MPYAGVTRLDNTSSAINRLSIAWFRACLNFTSSNGAICVLNPMYEIEKSGGAITNSRFRGSLAPKESAENVIVASYEGTRFTPISYKNGYITRYRAEIKMEFELRGTKMHFKRKIETQVEENISGSSRLSASLRIEAIKRGMAKALDQFLAYASTNGVLVEEAQKAKEIEELRTTP